MRAIVCDCFVQTKQTLPEKVKNGERALINWKIGRNIEHFRQGEEKDWIRIRIRILGWILNCIKKSRYGSETLFLMTIDCSIVDDVCVHYTFRLIAAPPPLRYSHRLVDRPLLSARHKVSNNNTLLPR